VAARVKNKLATIVERLDISLVSAPMGAVAEDKVGMVVTLGVAAGVEVVVHVIHVARRVTSPGSVLRVRV
jgi:hypothetical protein